MLVDGRMMDGKVCGMMSEEDLGGEKSRTAANPGKKVVQEHVARG